MKNNIHREILRFMHNLPSRGEMYETIIGEGRVYDTAIALGLTTEAIYHAMRNADSSRIEDYKNLIVMYLNKLSNDA